MYTWGERRRLLTQESGTAQGEPSKKESKEKKAPHEGSQEAREHSERGTKGEDSGNRGKKKCFGKLQGGGLPYGKGLNWRTRGNEAARSRNGAGKGEE